MSVAIPSLRGAIAVPEWAKNELWRKARVVPSLDLRFADLKSLVDATTGNNLVTFARGGSGAYVGSDGLIKTATTNEPRFTHDPVTGESLGLLVEEQRVNLLQRTEEFDNVVWTKSAATATANAALSPDGLTGADKLVEDNTTATHFVRQNVAGVIGTVYTSSVFVKAGERSVIVVSHFDGATFSGVQVNLVTGAISSPPSDLAIADASSAALVRQLQNGWYRISITRTQVSTTTAQVRVALISGSNGVYLGDGSSGVYLWGAQLEAGSFPTSYIKNIDNPLGATRAADVVSIDGANYTSFYQEGPLTLFVAGKQLMPITDGRVLVGIRATSNVFGDAPYISRTDSNFSAFGAVNLNLATSVTDTSTTFRTAGALDANNGRMAASGVLSTLDTSCSLPVSTQGMTIGQRSWASSGNFANATISRVMYWPQRLPDSTLQAITL